MNFSITLPASGIKKAYLLGLLIFISFHSYSQSCDCPALDDCGPCEGGLTSLTLEYTGGLLGLVNVEIRDGGGVIYSQSLSGNTIITVFSSAGNGALFAGDFVRVSGTSLLGISLFSDILNTDCSDPVTPGTSYTYFNIISSTDVISGTVCCEEEDMETNPPVISNCPADIISTLGASECTTAVTWTPPTATDDCGTPTVENTHNSGEPFPIGTTIVTYTFTDDYDNSSTCSFNVTVNDETAPVFTGCPTSDIIVPADGSCEAIVSWEIPTVTDCSEVTVTPPSYSSGDTFPIGTTTVTYTATDEHNNTSTCSFDVTVQDTTKPTITCHVDKFISADASCGTLLPDYTGATTNDNCSSITLMQSPEVGTPLGLGIITVVLTATDEGGNIGTCEFEVTVEDTTKPTITCPADKTISADAACDAVLSDYTTEATAADNCSVTVTQDPPINTPLIIGTNTVILTATDPAGNQATCTFDVIVEDITKPTITCPTDKTISVDGTCDAVLPDYTSEATAADNCPVTVTQEPPINSPLRIGTTTVTLTATDPAGNTGTCSFDVTVEDATNPTVSCPPDQTISADASCEITLPDYRDLATAVDNCSSAPTIVQSPVAGTSLPKGITTVTLTAADAVGNEEICTFNVNVVDDTAPVISGCPSNIYYSLSSSECSRVASWEEPTVTGNCQPMTSNYKPGHNFSPGTTTVTYTASDDFNNTITCSFDVIVEDTIKPQIWGCSPATVIEVTADSSCEAIVSWEPFSASDNCNFTLTSNYRSGDAFAVGTTSVVYTATDDSGNKTTCTFKVKVKDRTAPVVSGCIPSPITATASSGSCYATVNWTEPSAVDNCETIITRSHTPGDAFPIGTTIVTYSFRDNSDNISTCSFNVVVEGVIQNDGPPVISGCPGDITAEADASGQVTVDWFAPTATASCGEAVLASSHSPGDLFPVGTTNVQYVATDFAGRTSSCSFDIIVSYEDLEFDIAKVITPDGDGINDEWVLSNIERFSDNKVVIVDRWGSVVFSASGYNNENVVWKGMNRNGALVPTGTYFYTISVRFMTDVVEKVGFIEVIR